MATNTSGSHAHPAKNGSIRNAASVKRPITMATSLSRVGGVVAPEVEEDEGAPLARGGGAPRVMASDTAECETPALQPASGQFDIQVWHVHTSCIDQEGGVQLQLLEERSTSTIIYQYSAMTYKAVVLFFYLVSWPCQGYGLNVVL